MTACADRLVKRYKTFMLCGLLVAAAASAAGGFPAALCDQFGREVTIPKEPQRIISCAPGNTELLFALGLETRIVGVTNWCNYPLKAQQIEKIGDISPLNLEKIVSLHPDLILAHELNGAEAIDRLAAFGLPVLILKPTDFGDIIAAVELTGQATGRAGAAAALKSKLQGTIAEVRHRGEKTRRRGLKVFILLGWEPFWTAGPGSYLDEAVTLAGGTNVAHDLGASWAQANLETIVKRNPDVIITDIDPAKILGDPAWRRVAAIQKRQIYRVVGDEYYRPGPRLVEVLPDLARLLEMSK